MPAGCDRGGRLSILLPAPAKVNLALEVGPRMPDGYHRVRTVLQAVNLCDLVRLDPGDGIEVTCDSSEVPGGAENLAWRAARALREAVPRADLPGVRVHLFKVIPPAAGLGGASSDAATTLRGLTWLWRVRPSRAKLEELASRLGSDVPFFLSGGTALGEGRGDRCRPLPGLPECILVVVCPARRVTTAEVYRRWDEHPRPHVPEGRGTDAVKGALERGDLPGVAHGLWNDLRAVTETLAPEVREIREVLAESGALGAEMSGSGPATFGLFDSLAAAARAVERARARGHRAFLCRPAGAWPLYPGEGDFP
ncbi:MAG: 4-(cytidine 5'-diphospho)-2-C-methyl-D-erythritol kinase [Bacillota bacterium]|nr:4-(cytidine 5'-diphospho)-2-C-methyl-D-erythritol kinase [Bacillota bacterium]MDI7249533.1 4-(cytidine 5'-diphospho)-2-C-methyl-D-erythritol kinase [Bacillota bacterium]